jgi:hypothetical protein
LRRRRHDELLEAQAQGDLADALGHRREAIADLDRPEPHLTMDGGSAILGLNTLD